MDDFNLSDKQILKIYATSTCNREPGQFHLRVGVI